MGEGDRSLATCQVEKFSFGTASTAVSLEESPPASPSGPSISRMTPSQFFALDSVPLSQEAPKQDSVLLGGFKFFNYCIKFNRHFHC